ncbi:protein-L-isoaspartate(D-aspartate) O-methyltransferase [Sphingomonas sp.]|uniref:protein-L-isoaspartate(D-aspartate) O-methyltransferase n=1 Tax=Sphingomonas sp. TaxID=28214 RepID=UPI00286D84D4|nr:protein-L-isoaspartate(D-aspartate) O-methyltransferase [Sphingomonas sp.]
MIELHIAARGVRDPALLAAFRAVPRELFVAAEYAAEAYGDHPLPIAAGQTISQPYIVALMVDAAAVGGGDCVLEVGAGSGYAAAILGHLAASVVAVERHAELADAARARLARLGLANVRIVDGDGTGGWPAAAPYDAILTAAAAPAVPPALVDQLGPGGRRVIPLGAPGGIQQLVRLTRDGAGRLARDDLCAVRFVPLVGG